MLNPLPVSMRARATKVASADSHAANPSRLLVLYLSDERALNVPFLTSLAGRPVVVIPIEDFLRNLFDEYRGQSADRSHVTSWRRRIRRLVASDQLFLIGPIDRLETISTSNEVPSLRQFERFFCNMTNVFSPNSQNIVLFSAKDPKKLSFDRIMKSKMRSAQVFRSELDLAEHMWNTWANKLGTLVNADTPLDAELRGLIGTVLQDKNLPLTDMQRQALAQRLLDQLAVTMAKRLDDILNVYEVVDPVSKLVVPPTERGLYSQRNGELANLNAPKFLAIVWNDYLEAGLLYTGHLKKVDPSLYNALIYLARQTARGVAEIEGREWEPRDTANLLFSKFRILTEEHLDSPPTGYERQSKLIREANMRQKKSLRDILPEHNLSRGVSSSGSDRSR